MRLRLSHVNGEVPLVRRTWYATFGLLALGGLLVGVGLGTGVMLATYVGLGQLLLGYVVAFALTLRLQRREHRRRLADLAAHRAAMMERHEASRAELRQIREMFNLPPRVNEDDDR